MLYYDIYDISLNRYFCALSCIKIFQTHAPACKSGTWKNV